MPRSAGSIVRSRREPSTTSQTRFGPAGESSSIPKAPWTTKARLAPRCASTSASVRTSSGAYTPTICERAPAGFVSGPSTLKTVRVATSRRTGAAWLIAGWCSGANMKPKPSSSIDSAMRSAGRSSRNPSASSTSAEPDADETARFPCLATAAPAAAATTPAAVEMLSVRAPSPPVPAVSTRSVRRGRTGTTCSRIASAQPAISSAVSPFARNATRKAPICAGVASPRMISPITSRDDSRPRSRPSSKVWMASWIILPGSLAGPEGRGECPP